jgi:hypothetical protein
MSEAWDRVRRRYALVEEVLGDIGGSGTAVLPRWQERIEAEYDGEGVDGFLRDVQRRWHRAFDARLDAVLENDTPDPALAVTHLWQTLSAAQPAVRLVLDAYDGHPALDAAETRHRAMLRAATGVDLADVRAQIDTPSDARGPRACRLAGLLRARSARRRHAAPQAA